MQQERPRRREFGGGRGRFERGGPRRLEGPTGPPQIDYGGLVEFVVRAVADDQEQVLIESLDRSGGAIAVKIKLSEQDVGRVIGKAGRNIEALRTLVRVASLRERRRVFVDLA